MKQAELLEDIMTLYHNGDRSDALALIDLYLDDMDDPHAHLLKVEMCIELDEQAEYVGQILVELAARIGHTSQFQQLFERVEHQISRKMSEGRDHLRRKRHAAALVCVEAACALAPSDPTVPLAAARSWLTTSPEEDSGTGLLALSDPFARRRQTRSEDADDEEEPEDGIEDEKSIPERFLRRAMTLAEPGSSIYEQAEQLLLRHWLDCEEVERLVSWLEHHTLSEEFTKEIQDKLDALIGQRLDRTLVGLMRAGAFDDALDIVTRCGKYLHKQALETLLRGEIHRLRGDDAQAKLAYEHVLQRVNCSDETTANPPAFDLDVWLELTACASITCPMCGKSNPIDQSKCLLCASALKPHQLTSNRYDLNGAPAEIIAHIALAELLPESCQQERVDHIQAAADALPNEYKGTRRTLLEWGNELAISEVVADETVPVPGVVREQRITGEVLDELNRIDAQVWAAVPLQTRLAVIRRLLKADLLEDARRLAGAIFADKADLPSVRAMFTQVEQVIDARVNELVDRARSALIGGHVGLAVQAASDALTLKPRHVDAHMIRGEAHFRTGRYPDALADFQQVVISTSSSREMIQSAQMTAARAMERLGQTANALATLADIPGEEGDRLRERLKRRQRDEPHITIELSDELVMVDTLSTAKMRHYRGYFAVTVREVGRPWKASAEHWRDSVLTAGYTFIEVLGGLRNTPGDPVFALRLISQPNPDISERGRLTLALLVRVTADREDECRQTALELWRALRDILPGAGEHVYTFEPVVDPAELAHLREPFPVDNVAEIVRREEVPKRPGERYAIAPFTAGNLDLRNLCETLLRQKAPVMVSIHLLPTSLMPWEHNGLNQMMTGKQGHAGEMADEPGMINLDDPATSWWQHAPSMDRAQANRSLLDNLQSGAYALAINVAGSQPTPLLPERIAPALFGSSHGNLCGGYEIVRALTETELETARRNLAGVELERWVFSAAPEGMPRLRHLVGQYEAAVAFRLPVPGYDGLPGVRVADTRPVPPPPGLAAEGVQLGESVVRVNGAALPITQGNDDRRRHTYIVGRTGTGKSTLMKNLALQDIEAGEGVCVVDPHGDLIEDLLPRIPAHRMDDVILFDPADDRRPVGLNLLEHRSETEKHLIVNEFLAMLMRMYDPGQTGIVGPRFQHNVRNGMLTAMSVPDNTLIEVVRVLSDSRFVRKLLPKVTDPLVRRYWTDQVASTTDFHKSEILDYIVSKFNPFVGDRRVRHIIGQRRTTIDFRRVMDERKILLVNLCKGKIGAENAQFLGLLLVQRLLMTALSRADVPEDRRPDFMLYVDEFQNFATRTFTTILSEGRKYGVAATVANQYLTQLDPPVREAIFGNVGTLINFRLGTNDAVALTPEMYPTFSGDDLINLPKYTACVKLLVDGLAARPFSMRTLLDMRLPDHERAAAIRAMSRRTYGRDAEDIQNDITTRYDE